MARCIFAQPQETERNAAETKVAEFLLKLPDSFLFRWGHYYDANGKKGEGDFLVYGPGNVLLVLEVKGGSVAYDPATQRYLTSSGENPLLQRDHIWGAVLKTLQQQGHTRNLPLPLVLRMVALPDVEITSGQPFYEGMPRTDLLDASDLKDFSRWWQENCKKNRNFTGMNQLVSEVYFSELREGATRIELDFAGQVIERMTRSKYELLDALEENRRLAFSGGPGTGKTWLLFEQALRWAQNGKKVLFLTYNLGLEIAVKAIFARLEKKTVSVFSYENLAKSLFAEAGEVFPEVNRIERKEMTQLFDQEVPRTLRKIVKKYPESSKYDCLVVDEAQDHDTKYHPEVGASEEEAGWWEIYAGLLRDFKNAPVTIGYDSCQRHFAREKSFFDAERIERLFPGFCKVRLHKPLRYTMALIEYFRGLEDASTQQMLRDMRGEEISVMGETPKRETANSADEERIAVGRLLNQWTKQNGEVCRSSEIMILYPTSQCRPQWMNLGSINGIPIGKAGGVMVSSIPKAKGLEFRAVIVVGFPPWEKMKNTLGCDAAKLSFVQGVTRARLLLSVVERTDLDPTELRIV